MRQIGLRASQLEGVGRAHLDAWARAYAKVRLMDEYIATHGLLDEAGNPPPFLGHYWTALNTANRSLKALEENLRQRQDVRPDAGLETLIATGRRIREARELEAGS